MLLSILCFFVFFFQEADEAEEFDQQKIRKNIFDDDVCVFILVVLQFYIFLNV